ncbi:hypothetical protein LCGC14_2811110 [marine sediment metagenome]|uniref:Radical SAM core domain-containing protein n=1 Tax=marine sediment metagenome TaxID=412755 RepID=A0A0F8Z6M2_9ZZZZ
MSTFYSCSHAERENEIPCSCLTSLRPSASSAVISSLAVASEMVHSNPRAAYVHVPFCRHRCGYCNFTLVAGRDDLVDDYLRAIELELRSLQQPREVDTLFLGGGTLTLSGSDQDINFGVGEARVGTSADRSLQNGYLDSATIKQLDTVSGWVEGSNAAGRPAADSLAANKWHHCFIITKADGTIDAGFDDDINAANLIAAGEAGGETPPYVNFRYWGSVKETAAGDGTCRPFIQHGNHFLWTTIPGLDVNLTAQDWTSQANLTLDFTPPGVPVLADINTLFQNMANHALLGHGGQTIPAVTDKGTAMGMYEVAEDLRLRTQLWTNASQQIVVRVLTDTTADLHIEVHGYMNPRGQWD